MPVSDLMLKARVNLALVRDPRVGVLDIGVRSDDDIVTLTGDVDSAEEKVAAEEITRSVDGVRAVRNEITVDVGLSKDRAEQLRDRLLGKLTNEWEALEENTAVTQAEYLRWALWMVHKYRLPDRLRVEDWQPLELSAREDALARVAGYVGAPKALVAYMMMAQAELAGDRPVAAEENGPLLVTTPRLEKEEAAA